MSLIGSLSTSGATLLRGSSGFPAPEGSLVVPCPGASFPAGRAIHGSLGRGESSNSTRLARPVDGHLLPSPIEPIEMACGVESFWKYHRGVFSFHCPPESRLVSGTSLAQALGWCHPEYLSQVLMTGRRARVAMPVRHFPPNVLEVYQGGDGCCSSMIRHVCRGSWKR